LSYTAFEYSDLNVVHTKTSEGTAHGERDLVTVKVKNTGTREGAEVVQLYIHDGHSKIDRPVHELKRFQRIELKAGETSKIQFTLDRAALSYWSQEKKDWVAEPGKFEIEVGASSRDIRLRAPLELRR
jgi:beta-glucosidase